MSSTVSCHHDNERPTKRVTIMKQSRNLELAYLQFLNFDKYLRRFSFMSFYNKHLFYPIKFYITSWFVVKLFVKFIVKLKNNSQMTQDAITVFGQR